MKLLELKRILDKQVSLLSNRDRYKMPIRFYDENQKEKEVEVIGYVEETGSFNLVLK